MLKIILLLCSFNLFANDIDKNCPSLTYKSAPIVQADQYLCRTWYAVAYSYKTKTPVYTTEFLTKSHIGNIARTNDFRADKDIPVQYQASPKDYVGAICNTGRCDKGHASPDQDFSATLKTTSESFLMSNMMAQQFQCNEIIWKYMETHFRNYVNKGNDLYIITGPIYEGTSSYIGKSHIQVPSSLFKIGIDAKTGKSIAFVMKNINIPTTDLIKQVNNIEYIEKATGIVFDKSLDKKTIANYGEWFGK